MTLFPGARLGPYEILAPLGAGGMGEVYRARDPRLGREVAIKTLPDRLARNGGALDRFEREAKAVAALSHPNILAIHDVGADQGISYAVTELLQGQTLRERLGHGPVPWRKAVEIGAAIADGLAAAHAQGIVHRDLKPENVFLTSDGRVKILDFGLAGQAAANPANLSDSPTVSRHTEPGTVLGTVGYMAPEQVRGLGSDPRSDIFALGTVLYEMVSGRRAFQRDTAVDTMSAILNEDPPASAPAVVPHDLDRLIRRCLEKNPDERFQSARDLAFDLRPIAGESSIQQGRRSRTALAAAGAALALAVIAAGALFWMRGPARERTTATPKTQSKSIAVLPFQNLSPDPENAFFADGITEDVLTQLAKIRDLKVISRTSVMRYKNTQKPIREIAGELGVGTVLEGSVRRAGNRVRITGQLVDAATDEHLWAETYDRDLQDVFAIQSEVAQQIASALQAQLTPAEKQRIELRPTRDLEAYDLYLKGRELYYRYRKNDNEQAIGLFQRALKIDPGFALAYAGLGDAYAQRIIRFGFPPTWLEESLEASRKAVALDPQLPEAYKSLGLSYLTAGRMREAVEANRRAVELKPNQAAAHGNLGFVLFHLGRWDDALSSLKRSVELDPTNPNGLAEGIGPISAALGDRVGAEAAWRQALELQPESPSVSRFRIAVFFYYGRPAEALSAARGAPQASTDPALTQQIALAEVVAGDLQRGRELLERALPALRDQRRPQLATAGAAETNLAAVYLRLGRQRQAEGLLDEALQTDRRMLDAGNQLWSIPLDIACVHALRGDKDEAFRWLDRTVEAGWRGFPLAPWSPLLDPLRDDPRFRALMTRMNAMIAEMRRKAGLGATG